MTALAKPGAEAAPGAAAAAAGEEQSTALEEAFTAVREQVQSGAQRTDLEEPEISETDRPAPVKDAPAAAAPEPKKDEPPPEGAAAAEEEPPPEAAAGEGEAEPEAERLVELPAVPDRGQEPLEVEFESKEIADRVRAAVRDGLRRDRFNDRMRVLDDRAEAIESVEDEIEVDPVRFTVDRLDPKRFVDVALALLLKPGVYDAVQKRIEGWDYPERREAEALKAEAAQLRGEKDFERQLRVRSISRQQARIAKDAIDRIIPEDFDDDTAAMMREDLTRDLAAHVQQNRLASLRPGDIPRILERRLRQYSVTLADAETAVASRSPAPVRTPAGKGAAPRPTTTRTTPDAASAADKLKKGLDRRRAAAATPGAGAGAPTGAPALPKHASIKERVAHLRGLIGK